LHNQVLASFIILGLVASFVVLGTYAYFSDTETSTDNSLTAGTLDLWVNGSTTGSWYVSVDDLKPCLVNYSSPLVLKIVDNPGKLYLRIRNIVCGQGNQSEPETIAEGGIPKFDLANYTWYDLNVSGNILIPDGSYTVASLENYWIYLGEFPELTDVPVIQSFHIQAGVGNWAQGDQCNFTEDFMALQTNAPHPDNVWT
jgi:predicted ribosomally synthesized peptide with SipW-like signal peptide